MHLYSFGCWIPIIVSLLIYYVCFGLFTLFVNIKKVQHTVSYKTRFHPPHFLRKMSWFCGPSLIRHNHISRRKFEVCVQYFSHTSLITVRIFIVCVSGSLMYHSKYNIKNIQCMYSTLLDWRPYNTGLTIGRQFKLGTLLCFTRTTLKTRLIARRRFKICIACCYREQFRFRNQLNNQIVIYLPLEE